MHCRWTLQDTDGLPARSLQMLPKHGTRRHRAPAVPSAPHRRPLQNAGSAANYKRDLQTRAPGKSSHHAAKAPSLSRGWLVLEVPHALIGRPRARATLELKTTSMPICKRGRATALKRRQSSQARPIQTDRIFGRPQSPLPMASTIHIMPQSSPSGMPAHSSKSSKACSTDLSGSL